MASTEKAKNKTKKSIENSNLGKPGPKSKRTKPVGSKREKRVLIGRGQVKSNRETLALVQQRKWNQMTQMWR